jgi:hypothetical protein
MQDFIVAARKARPRWGPRMLRNWLDGRHPGRQFRSVSSFASILNRNGLTVPRARGRAVHFGRILLGHFDDQNLQRGFCGHPRPRKSHYLDLQNSEADTPAAHRG